MSVPILACLDRAGFVPVWQATISALGWKLEAEAGQYCPVLFCQWDSAGFADAATTTHSKEILLRILLAREKKEQKKSKRGRGPFLRKRGTQTAEAGPSYLGFFLAAAGITEDLVQVVSGAGGCERFAQHPAHKRGEFSGKSSEK